MVIIFAKLFLKDLQKITDVNLKREVLKAIEDFESNENVFELSSIKKMRGHSEAYRLRIGKYRLGFYYGGKNIMIARFVKREIIYNLFP